VDLAALIAMLERPLVQVGGSPVTWTELFGFVTGAVCVWLVARQHAWNWPIGIANNAFFALLFFRAGLYAETVLQLIFAGLACYGWWNWLHGGGAKDGALAVRRVRATEALALAAAGAASTGLVALALDRGTDSTVPFWDALVLALSLVATYGQTQKHLESWWVWIAVDVVSIPLYVSRGLLLTAALYSFFLLLCVMGLRRWAADLRLHAEAGYSASPAGL
jgi:nicotinamide mononucleotide transporter